MAIGGVSAYSSTSYYYSAIKKSQSEDIADGMGGFAGLVSQNNEDGNELVEDKKSNTNLPYTRVITASIETEELYGAMSNGKMVYSYQKTEQSFEITINSDGSNKTYSISGYDKDGNKFEKEINPYEIDPEYADFPEFAALCMYIQQTDDTADMLANDYFATDDILEKGNYLEKLQGFSMDSVFEKTEQMMECANKLVETLYQLSNIQSSIDSIFEPFMVKYLVEDVDIIDYPDIAGKISEDLSSEAIKEVNDEEIEAQEIVTPLGFGFANAGNMGYGMSAALVEQAGNDDTIIRVKISTGSGTETIDVNLSNFDPKNATPVEMFAYCQYKDAIGEGVDSKWGSWNAIKSVMSPLGGADFGSLDNIMNKKMNWNSTLSNSKVTMENQGTGKTLSASDLLKWLEENNTLTTAELKEDKDWREMSDDEWDKLLEHIDKYIDAYKERLKQLKEMQEEAATKAAMLADADMKTTAASEAATNVAANGLGEASDSDIVGSATTKEQDKMNWTKNLETDDQTVLSEASAAQSRESSAISKLQELQLTETTTVGTTSTENVTECASVDKDENGEKIWTITCFGADGITSQRCSKNGVVYDSWEIKYKNAGDAQRVLDFIGRFNNDADLKFSGSKEFWEEFLNSDINADTMFERHGAEFDKAAPNAPAIVKKAWMEAAKESGYLAGGKMNHISQILVRQVINRENGVEDYQDVFGDSVASALQAAKEMLFDLENPLTPDSERSESVRMYREQEKEFYKKFIEDLEEISGILVGDEYNMHINKELAQKYSSQLKPVDDIADVLKQPMQLAGHTQVNKANNLIDIALGASVRVPGGFTLVVKEYGVEVQGVTNWNNQKESQEASDMAGALATLLRNASGQLQHVGTNSSRISQWNEDVEKVLGYFGIDTSMDFTVNGVKYTRDGSGIHKKYD